MASKQKEITRRRFFRDGASVAGAGLGALIVTSPSSLFSAVPPSERITVGYIGVGARVSRLWTPCF